MVECKHDTPDDVIKLKGTSKYNCFEETNLEIKHKYRFSVFST